MAKRTWSDLSPNEKRTVYAAGAVEAILTLAALRDMARRSPDAVRGPRSAWALGCFVQPVGPLLYFAVGRR